MTAGRRGFPAHFDQDAWEEDLARSTPPGRQAAEGARRDYERDGVPFEHARRVQEHGRDGTVLPNCAKVYLPQPAGRFGMIFRAINIKGQPHLTYLAFGVRHHPSTHDVPPPINSPTNGCTVSHLDADTEDPSSQTTSTQRLSGDFARFGFSPV